MPNIFMFLSWFILLLVIAIAWRRSEPKRRTRNTLVAVIVYLIAHAAIAFLLLRIHDVSHYFTLFWSWKVWWLAQ